MQNNPIHLVVSGCCGRMGSLIVEEALKQREYFTLVGGLERQGHPALGQSLAGQAHLKVSDNLESLLSKADLLIEFTTPEASLDHAQRAAGLKVPVLIGTTGFALDQLDTLRQISQRIPIFWSPNMSIGIVILRKTIACLFDLYKRFDLDSSLLIRISETHHAQKKDAPSGTAKLLAEEIRRVTGRTIPEREIEAKREGQVVGIHRVTFDSRSEQIHLEHAALDRRIFALGALVVARSFPSLFTQPGFFGMDDFLGRVMQSKKNSRGDRNR